MTNETTILSESLNDFTTVRAPAVPCKCRRFALPHDGAFLNDSRNVRHSAEGCASPTTIETLIKQLGTALPMLGARDLVASGSALQFKIRGCKAGNKIRIALRPDDTYAVELWHVKGTNVFQVGETVEQVHADNLHAVLANLTGLDTRI